MVAHFLSQQEWRGSNDAVVRAIDFGETGGCLDLLESSRTPLNWKLDIIYNDIT